MVARSQVGELEPDDHRIFVDDERNACRFLDFVSDEETEALIVAGVDTLERSWTA